MITTFPKYTSVVRNTLLTTPPLYVQTYGSEIGRTVEEQLFLLFRDVRAYPMPLLAQAQAKVESTVLSRGLVVSIPWLCPLCHLLLRGLAVRGLADPW